MLLHTLLGDGHWFTGYKVVGERSKLRVRSRLVFARVETSRVSDPCRQAIDCFSNVGFGLGRNCCLSELCRGPFDLLLVGESDFAEFVLLA